MLGMDYLSEMQKLGCVDLIALIPCPKLFQSDHFVIMIRQNHLSFYYPMTLLSATYACGFV